MRKKHRVLPFKRAQGVRGPRVLPFKRVFCPEPWEDPKCSKTSNTPSLLKQTSVSPRRFAHFCNRSIVSGQSGRAPRSQKRATFFWGGAGFLSQNDQHSITFEVTERLASTVCSFLSQKGPKKVQGSLPEAETTILEPRFAVFCRAQKTLCFTVQKGSTR